jgi:hypothetical protein
MPERTVLFGVSLGAWNGVDAADAAGAAGRAVQADGDGLDGASGFIYRTTDDTPATVANRRFAAEIVPAVREAVAGRPA